ncbi:hypothetical protein BJI69_06955 [Luteibacter rhizovicinus DSM 16549]|uniref:Uncharacterized protein n=1 Tax=Luteibacter rhizovicinus DSM 16549 TaxID=1440763 RepID=A0A0G9HG05_9GAMM|nr:hypothetical protein [Luteibacter rhizovicinus]APG03668.1 hypothetical protein BJI69_06955 [Luteibacter rhizovicinus DSM 16549]KLD68618.1 hypothetical protein Y883_01060 [Luteibacter rhizovicinus DSM 16549]KLD75323.1 hypothetical protein Y886_27680 [Xanthomonas hyacinthi DSM 19077]
MNRLALLALMITVSACSSKVTQEAAESLSSVKVAKTTQCVAPLLEEKSFDPDEGYLFVWKCQRERDGSQRTLEVTVSTKGDVDLRSMTMSPDDPVFELHLKDH